MDCPESRFSHNDKRPSHSLETVDTVTETHNVQSVYRFESMNGLLKVLQQNYHYQISDHVTFSDELHCPGMPKSLYRGTTEAESLIIMEQ